MAVKVTHRFGNKGSKVAVLIPGTQTLAKLYAEDGVTPVENPVTVTPNGYVMFASPEGEYDLVESGQGTNKARVNVAAPTEDAAASEVVLSTTVDSIHVGSTAPTNPTGRVLWFKKL